MAQPAGNPKIDDLRARVKADPKSRLFYPLAEELRKDGQLKEAEEVLVAGLAGNPTYLSAWVSLGRVLKDLGKPQGAIEALNKALSFDRENIVAARLLAHLYLDSGNKVEAIKKFKLVHALLPTDLEAEAHINELDRELNPPTVTPIAVSESAVADAPSIADVSPEERHPEEAVAAVSSEPVSPPAALTEQPEQPQSPFMPSDEEHLWQEDVDRAEVTPEPAPAPRLSPVPVNETPFVPPAESDSPFEDESRPPVAAADDLTATVTMGDLYAQQGYHDSAREIYEKILAAHPDAEDVKAKLQALPGGVAAQSMVRRDVVVRRLQDWLSKVGRREAVGRI